MKTNKNKKSGFTLVELMVVAIIVAILAAVAIPLMSGNTQRAIATEGQTGCSTIATAIRMFALENDASAVSTLDDLPAIEDGDLDGEYFDDGSYAISDVSADGRSYTITATVADGNEAGETVIMTVDEGDNTWGGTLYGDDPPAD